MCQYLEIPYCARWNFSLIIRINGEKKTLVEELIFNLMVKTLFGFGFSSWSSIDDIMPFAYSLPKKKQQFFLITFEAFVWCIWKQRNLICFKNKSCSFGKNIILSIMSDLLDMNG